MDCAAADMSTWWHTFSLPYAHTMLAMVCGLQPCMCSAIYCAASCINHMSCIHVNSKILKKASFHEHRDHNIQDAGVTCRTVQHAHVLRSTDCTQAHGQTPANHIGVLSVKVEQSSSVINAYLQKLLIDKIMLCICPADI